MAAIAPRPTRQLRRQPPPESTAHAYRQAALAPPHHPTAARPQARPKTATLGLNSPKWQPSVQINTAPNKTAVAPTVPIAQPTTQQLPYSPDSRLLTHRLSVH